MYIYIYTLLYSLGIDAVQIRGIIARKEGEPGNEAIIHVHVHVYIIIHNVHAKFTLL